MKQLDWTALRDELRSDINHSERNPWDKISLMNTIDRLEHELITKAEKEEEKK